MAFRAKPTKLNADQLWNYALKALGQRAHSTDELKKKLARRAERPADVAATVNKLREYGMIDDRKFSEALATSRLQNQGFGQYRVLRELRAKRVADTAATDAIEKVYAGTNEAELIEAFLARKYRNENLPEFLKDVKKLAGAFRRLRMAGFTSSGSLAVLKRYTRTADEWEEPAED